MTKLEIVREAQQEEYSEKIIALTGRKELCRRGHLLPLTPLLDADILQANRTLC